MIQIADRSIDRGRPPFIIAEMSGNHNQSLDRALQIVEAAAQAGADALKLQTYTADTMTLDIGEGEFFIDDPNSLWHGRSLYELYQQAHTPLGMARAHLGPLPGIGADRLQHPIRRNRGRFS